MIIVWCISNIDCIFSSLLVCSFFCSVDDDSQILTTVQLNPNIQVEKYLILNDVHHFYIIYVVNVKRPDSPSVVFSNKVELLQVYSGPFWEYFCFTRELFPHLICQNKRPLLLLTFSVVFFFFSNEHKNLSMVSRSQVECREDVNAA